MNKSLPHNLLLGIAAFIIYTTACAQESEPSNFDGDSKTETEKRIDDYLHLFKLGYSEREIFEDLGNVNFLVENYETAVFWYQKLLNSSEDEEVQKNYNERLQFAMQKAGLVEASFNLEEKDWLATIREDYQIGNKRTNSPYTSMAGSYTNSSNAPLTATSYVRPNLHRELAYSPPMTITGDGRTAYFTKAIEMKPLYGLFSKKQTVYKIFKAEKKNGQWKNIQQIAVCPKYASAMHPTVSKDGSRLFFASNMPGTYGMYDIYVSEIRPDGSLGLAKNLGNKVNTTKNDLYPNIIDGSLLTFASGGRKGQGGLDLYAVKVGRNTLSLAVNLGAPFNSKQDDFSLAVAGNKKGMGYVITNRGTRNQDVQQIAFTYANDEVAATEIAEDELLEILNSNLKSGYSNTTYDDQKP